jgi:hypothetical protein
MATSFLRASFSKFPLVAATQAIRFDLRPSDRGIATRSGSAAARESDDSENTSNGFRHHLWFHHRMFRNNVGIQYDIRQAQPEPAYSRSRFDSEREPVENTSDDMSAPLSGYEPSVLST